MGKGKGMQTVLLAILTLTGLARAQSASLYNLTVYQGATVINWQGKPALCVVQTPPFILAKFSEPAAVGPQVVLKVQALAAWDFRPCAAGSGWYFVTDDIGLGPLHQWVGTIPASGLDMHVPWTWTIQYDRFQWPATNYYVTYCKQMGGCSNCGLTDSNPQGVGMIAYLELR